MFPSTKRKVLNWLGLVHHFWLRWGEKPAIEDWRDLIYKGEVVWFDINVTEDDREVRMKFTRVPLPPPEMLASPRPRQQEAAPGTTRSPRQASDGQSGPAGSSS